MLKHNEIIYFFKQLPEEFEKNFYKILACLKNKDPKIYNENVKFFNDPLPKSEENSTKQKKEKSVFLRDYERQIIVERGGKFSDSEDEQNETKKQPQNPTYAQEQQELKESFKKALENDEVNEEDLLKPKTKTKEEVKRVIFIYNIYMFTISIRNFIFKLYFLY